MKKPRVKTIKNNIQPLTPIPQGSKAFKHDCDAGRWIDQQMQEKGHVVDHTGGIDLPEYGVDNKTRKQGSNAPHTVGSMTIDNIIRMSDWHQTELYKKLQNINHIVWDPVFMEIKSVELIDFDLPEIQQELSRAYADLQQQLVTNHNNGYRSKNITSRCKTMVFDGYGHENSYRIRIHDRAMKKFQTLSATRDSRNAFFEET